MFYKSPLVSPIAVAYLTLSTCIIISSSKAQDSAIPNSVTTSTGFPTQTTSNLITDNPFVPKNSGSLIKARKTSEPQPIANATQVLQKYIQFKSIAIIDGKKYFGIYNKRTNKSFWIKENETVENIRVTNYNSKNNTITITDGINSETISIIAANETPLSVIGVSEGKKDIKTPEIPGIENNQNEEKKKVTSRRRVIPAKR